MTMTLIERQCRRSIAAAADAYELLYRTIARRAAGDRSNHPVDFVAGCVEPHREGQGYYWTTPSGKTIVRHPNAYRWPTKYWPSTIRVVVGRDWPGLALAALPARQRRDFPRTAIGMRQLAATRCGVPITAAEVAASHNAEYRRALIEALGGIGTYMRAAGARVVHRDETGALLRIGAIAAVRVRDATHPRRRYVLRVPLDCATAREAVAWTFGLTAEEYRPTAES